MVSIELTLRYGVRQIDKQLTKDQSIYLSSRWM